MKINHYVSIKQWTLLLLCGLIDISSAQTNRIKTEQTKIQSISSSFRDTTDDAIDMSPFLLDHHDDSLVLFTIVESAAGYDYGFAPLYYHT